MRKKALFLDMDETLCATSQADLLTSEWLIAHLEKHYKLTDTQEWTKRYFLGVYKKLNHELPHLTNLLGDEFDFRCALIQTLFAEQGLAINQSTAENLQHEIDNARMANFRFYPGVEQLLWNLRQQYTLVVITNGPTFSQYPKLEAVNMQSKVDHIIVGGAEPEEKPAKSIFDKALKLANVSADEAVHVGDSLTSDIIGANQAGITSVWITAEEHSQDANFTIRRFTDLPNVLNALL